MHKELQPLLEKRCQQFTERLRNNIIEDFVVFDAKFSISKDHIKYSDRLNCEYKKISEGEHWGNAWDSAWFNLKVQVPQSWKGKKIAAKIDLAGEVLIFDKTETSVFALTNCSVFDPTFKKNIYQLEERAKGGEEIEFWVEAAANSVFGIHTEADPDLKSPTRHGVYDAKVNHIKLCVFDEEMWQLTLDAEVLTELMLFLPEQTPRRKKLLKIINRAADAYQDNRTNAKKCREILREALECKANASALTASAIGHAHIDTGWLWPVKESIRKCARTFSSQITLIERYPEYSFGASQPQHYDFIKEHYPELYAKIKKAVKEGRWEPQGGMWVEADCNLISGESMVRQFLYGKNFFKDEFDVDVKNLWLPDVFGYSAAMPQILKKSGVDFFLTHKISWNQFNKFPHHTFVWKGIDGTETVSHFIPSDTYNEILTPKELIYAENNFTESDVLDEFISVFGIGDGGGGPTDEHIERGFRMKNLEGTPKVKFEFAQNIFDRIIAQKDKLEKWSGELYLELHRGTLTTQAKVKKLNRNLESKLRFIEALYSCLDYKEYPHKEIDYIWKKVLINQFHDIIPGSSINKVYEVTHKEHEDCIHRCDKLIKIFEAKAFNTEEGCIVIYNALSSTYTTPIKLPKVFTGYNIVDSKGNFVISQDEKDGKVIFPEIPANSFIKLFKADKVNSNKSIKTDTLVLENNFIKYEFAKNGEIIKAFDKEENKEVLVKGNIFSLYVDRPANWDAWDIDIYYEKELIENARAVKHEVIATGSVRTGITFELNIGNSKIKQNIYLAKNTKRLDFETEVDWQEVHKMLRVSFDTNIVSEQAAFDIQYGYVKRNTHRNSSWDLGKFEVAAHKYVDLSDTCYGVALLNDCKYGHKVLDSIIDLNLLRSSTNPDPDADKFQLHEIKYSLYPHNGTLIESNVIHNADMLNFVPEIFVDKSFNTINTPCIIRENDGVNVETIKKAEKENVHVIRLVERFGKPSSITLEFDAPVEMIETDLLEWENNNNNKVDYKTTLTLKPFEIRTYKIRNF